MSGRTMAVTFSEVRNERGQIPQRSAPPLFFARAQLQYDRRRFLE